MTKCHFQMRIPLQQHVFLAHRTSGQHFGRLGVLNFCTALDQELVDGQVQAE